MKSKAKREMKAKTPEELRKEEKRLAGEIAQLRVNRKIGKLKNVREPARKRRELARVKTFLRQKEWLANGQKTDLNQR